MAIKVSEQRILGQFGTKDIVALGSGTFATVLGGSSTNYFSDRYSTENTTTYLDLSTYDANSSQISNQRTASAFYQYSNRTGPAGQRIDISSGDIDSLGNSAVVTWYQSGLWGGYYEMKASIQNGQPFTVINFTNFYDRLSSPKVAGLLDGNLAFTWTQQNSGSSSSEVYVRLTDQSGLALTNPFVVSAVPSTNRYSSQIENLSNGNFVVTWQSQQGGDHDAHARVFSQTGEAITPDLTLNAPDSIDQEGVQVTALADGGFAAIWRVETTDVKLRFFDKVGKPMTAVIDVGVSQYLGGSFAALADSRVLVVWSGTPDGSNSSGIWGQAYTPDGTPDGSAFLIKANQPGPNTAPLVTALNANEFKVVWQGTNQNVVTTTNAATVTLPDYAPALAVTAAAKVSGGNGNAIADEAGDVITYTVKVTNTGTVTLGGVSLTDGETGLFNEAGLILAPNEVKTFTGTYVLKQSDLNTAGGGDGVLNLIATADSNLTDAVRDGADVSLVTSPKLTLKSVVADVSGANAIADVAGEVVTIKTTVINSGNVTLTGITLTDSLSGKSEKALPLAPGASRDIESTYVITQADIDSKGGDDGKLKFDVRAESAQTAAQSAAGSISLGYDPKLVITTTLREITNAPDASNGNSVADEIGDILIYDYTIRNTGNVTLTNLSLIDSLTGLSIAGETLAPGGEQVFTDRRYVLSATDFETNGNGDADFDNLLIAVSDQTGTVSQESEPVKLVTYTREGDDQDNQLRGGSGADSINGKAGNDTINGVAGRDDLYGELGNDTLIGGSGADRLYGDIGNDILRADDGNDLLDGGVGNDQLFGGVGNDEITGGSGRDALSGGAGADRFVYEARGDFGDTISNFDKSDVFAFKASEFRMKKGLIDASRFQSRTDNKAQDFNDRFIYRTTDDTLWYDADGTGSQAAFKVADLSNDFKLLAADILIV